MEYLSFFVEQNQIVPEVGDWELTLRGDVVCHGGLILDVLKVLRINQRNQVLGVDYSYHARIAVKGDQPIFRYDNSHVHTELRHPDAYHKHLFSPFTGNEQRTKYYLGRAGMLAVHA